MPGTTSDGGEVVFSHAALSVEGAEWSTSAKGTCASNTPFSQLKLDKKSISFIVGPVEHPLWPFGALQ